jgi:hypothetical protein
VGNTKHTGLYYRNSSIVFSGEEIFPEKEKAE